MSWDNKNYIWKFGPRGCGMKWGPNDVGIGTFKKNPYAGLAKEILQNSMDAKDLTLENKAVCVVFEMIDIKRENIPGIKKLSKSIKACHEYYNEGENGEKTKLLYDAAVKYLDESESIPAMKISDYNTTGLCGSKEEIGTNWTGLVRESGACNNKGNGYGGAFGVGKYAPFNFSKIRTIIYSTLDTEGIYAFQGKTVLTTFNDEDDNEEKQPIGFFGLNNKNCDAIYNQNEVPEIFRRDRNGTDLFVLGCDADSDWMEQIIISILEYFFYPIYKKQLEICVKDQHKKIEINSDTISILMEKYKNYTEEKNIEFNAPLYWEILESKDTIVKKTNLCNKGEVELHFLVDPNFSDKRVAEMRKPGMLITEDTKFNKLYFHGIFIATGKGAKSDSPEDNIDSFLRKCENQAHDTWSAGEYEGDEKAKEEAKKVITKIHKWIRQTVKEAMPEPETKKISAFGLAELLPNMCSEGEEEKKEEAFHTFKPVPVQLITTSSRQKTAVSHDISKGKNKKRNKKKNTGKNNIPRIDSTDNHQQRKPRISSNPNPENRINRKLHSVNVNKIKTVYDRKSKKYSLFLTPESDEKRGYIMLNIGSDDNETVKADITLAKQSGRKLNVIDGMIEVPFWKKGDRVKIEVSGLEPSQLEVLTYAEK